MRNGSAKPPGWGLSGGRMEFPNVQSATGRNLSITVKNLTIDAEGNVLLVNEKYLAAKEQKAEQDFEQALRDMEKLIAHIQSRRSDITYDAVMRVLNETIPKVMFHGVKRFFSAEEIGDRKIDPNLTLDWDPESELTKINLTAIREELEETGLLIRPTPLVEVPNTNRRPDQEDDHKIVVCLAEIVSGRLKQESRETWAAEWFSLAELPPTKEENPELEVSQTMYKSHKLNLLPMAMRALLAKKHHLSEMALEKVKNFLAQYPAPNQNPS